MKNQIEKIEKGEEILKKRVKEIESRIGELEKISPVSELSIVRFTKPQGVKLTQEQIKICNDMIDVIDNQNKRFDEVLNFKSNNSNH